MIVQQQGGSDFTMAAGQQLLAFYSTDTGAGAGGGVGSGGPGSQTGGTVLGWRGSRTRSRRGYLVNPWPVVRDWLRRGG